VLRVRRQGLREGLAASLARTRLDRVYARSLDGDQGAHLIALTCGKPLAGRECWTSKGDCGHQSLLGCTLYCIFLGGELVEGNFVRGVWARPGVRGV